MRKYGVGVLALTLATNLACVRAQEESFALAPLPVRTEVLNPSLFQVSVTLLGKVRTAERIALVTTVSGVISYPARFQSGLRTGERVTAGEELATFDNEDARATLAEARIQSEAARASLDRHRRGLAQGVVSGVEHERAELEARLAQERLGSAERGARNTVLRAPRTGTLRVDVPLGAAAYVPSGTTVAELLVGGALMVDAWAAAVDRKSLKPGLTVRYLAGGSDGETVGIGVLREIATGVDAAGTMHVVADVGQDKGMPLPGEGVELRVELEPRPDTISVPEEAIVIDTAGSEVYVLEGSSFRAGAFRARAMRVELGGRGGGRVEILRGLKGGDRIAVSGLSSLHERVTLVTEVEKKPDTPPKTEAPPAPEAPGNAAH